MPSFVCTEKVDLGCILYPSIGEHFAEDALSLAMSLGERLANCYFPLQHCRKQFIAPEWR